MRPRRSPPLRTVPSALRTITAIWAAHPLRRITGWWRIEDQSGPEIRTTQRIMKLPISKSIIALALLMGWTAQAGISYGTFANSGNIPDGSSSGSAGTATASGFLPTISDISVKLNISGGFNGDLYAYLSYGGVLVPLLNRVGVTTGDGFGYGDTGFSVTLSSAGANDVHSYGSHTPSFNGDGQLTGTWQPDGRAIDPQSSPS